MDQKHHTCLEGFWIKNFGPGELKLIKWSKLLQSWEMTMKNETNLASKIESVPPKINRYIYIKLFASFAKAMQMQSLYMSI